MTADAQALIPRFVAVEKSWSFTSFYPFARNVQGTIVDVTGNAVATYDISGGGAITFCPVPMVSGACAIERRRIRRDGIGGNPFVWLDAYEHLDGAEYPVRTFRAVVEINGVEYDITEADVPGQPLALLDVPGGYTLKVWSGALEAGRLIRLWYWEAKYSLQRVHNPFWNGSNKTRWCIVLEQAAWKAITEDDGISVTLVEPGTWTLAPLMAKGSIDDITLDLGYGPQVIHMPSGYNTTYHWRSTFALGVGPAWHNTVGDTDRYLFSLEDTL